MHLNNTLSLIHFPLWPKEETKTEIIPSVAHRGHGGCLILQLSSLSLSLFISLKILYLTLPLLCVQVASRMVAVVDICP
jgi:hypothetical protein